MEICEFATNSLGVVRKVDSLVTAESWRRTGSHCLRPGDCANCDDRVHDGNGTDGCSLSDDRVDGDGSGGCGGWNWETQARASLCDVWRRELSNTVGNGGEIVALERCW